MSFWRHLRHGFRGLLKRTAQDREISEEVQQYLDEAVTSYKEQGLSEEDALRRVRVEFGDSNSIEEQVGSYGWENAVRTFFSDLRFGTRQLSRSLGFTVVCVFTLALGIGASSAIFSAVDPILFSPLPYPHSSRILAVWNTWQGARSELAFGTYLELSDRTHAFESTAIFEPWQPAMTGGQRPERLDGQRVSSHFFNVIGVSPALGRDFYSSEEGPNAPKVAVLSDQLWRHSFHSDRGILGSSIKLDGDYYTVIGVMPHGFEDVLLPSAEVWTPDHYDTGQATREFNGPGWGNHLRMIARLRPGITRAEAAHELDQIARNPWPQFPRPRWASLESGLLVDLLQDDVAHIVKPALWAVFGAVIVVLAIACVNVINLVLARNARRSGEFALRGALGASKIRIARQLMTEGLLLSGLGGALGIAAGVAGLRVVVALSPPELPRLEAIAFDLSSFLFAFVLVSSFGLAAGVVPALHISRNDLQSTLQSASVRIAGTHIWTRKVLVVAEIAFALIVLVSAGLLLRSMHRLIAVNPGFSSPHLLTMQVVTSGHQFDEVATKPGGGDRARHRFFEQALEAVRQIPNVQSAAFTSLLPLSDDPPDLGMYGAQFEDQDSQSGNSVFRYAISPGYCETMGIPLISGRLLDEHDGENAPQAALISKSLAKHHFGSRNPIGSRLHVGPSNRPWYSVVGVVGDVKQASLATDEDDAVYIPAEQSWFADDTFSFVIQTRGDPAPLVPIVESAIWSIDKNQPIVRVMTMDRMMAIAEAQRRFVLALFGTFGIVALLLAGVGLYGVMSGSVADGTHEIGIRMAMGAGRRDVLAWVFRDGMRLTAIGVITGLAGAYFVSRGIASLLFGTSPLDPVSWFNVVALMFAVAAVACWVPAWRSTKIDPAITLRAQ